MLFSGDDKTINESPDETPLDGYYRSGDSLDWTEDLCPELLEHFQKGRLTRQECLDFQQAMDQDEKDAVFGEIIDDPIGLPDDDIPSANEIINAGYGPEYFDLLSDLEAIEEKVRQEAKGNDKQEELFAETRPNDVSDDECSECPFFTICTDDSTCSIKGSKMGKKHYS